MPGQPQGESIKRKGHGKGQITRLKCKVNGKVKRKRKGKVKRNVNMHIKRKAKKNDKGQNKGKNERIIRGPMKGPFMPKQRAGAPKLASFVTAVIRL